MAIDFGAHLYPPGVMPDARGMGEMDEFLDGRLSDSQRVFDTYDGSGIDELVFSQPHYMGHGDTPTTARANDALLELIEPIDAHGLAAVPVAAGGEAAAAEFERCLDRGYGGGAVETLTDGIALTDSQLDPVFEVAASRDAPVFVHPKLDKSLGPDVLGEYRHNAVFGRETALAAAVSGVVHAGVFDRYPDLKLVFHHFGGNIASMMGRIDLQLQEGRWPGESQVTSFGEFKARLEDNVYVDTSGFFSHPAPLRTALEEFPAAQILLGTDFPFEARTTEELREFVETVRAVAPEDDAERILAGNARDILYGVD